MPTPPDDLLHAKIVAEFAKLGNKAAVAKKLKVNRGTVINHLRDLTPPVPPASTSRDFHESNDGTATLSLHTETPVKTLEDAIRVAQVDTRVWYVDRFEVSDWTVPMKVEQGQEEKTNRWLPSKPIQTQQYRIRVYLRRIVTRSMNAALDIVFEKFRNSAPVWPKPSREKATRGEPFLAVFGLFDVHFGKLAWTKETNENYDLSIAESVFSNAVEDLVSECGHRSIAKILVPFGNDWLHIDSRTNSTTRGTPQDVDGRFSKVFAAAKVAAIRAVETLAAIAPVEVVLVPGNHDRTLSECLCHILDARFHRTSQVVVNLDPKTRKYIHWGTNLIGLTHGDMVKPEKLPSLMPAEAKKEWAETTCHEWLTGHGHRSQKWTTMDTDTQVGTVVRQLRALTRTDLWHFDYGYVGSAPGAECYFYGRDRGYAGHAVVPTRC